MGNPSLTVVRLTNEDVSKIRKHASDVWDFYQKYCKKDNFMTEVKTPRKLFGWIPLAPKKTYKFAEFDEFYFYKFCDALQSRQTYDTLLELNCLTRAGDEMLVDCKTAYVLQNIIGDVWERNNGS